MTFASDLPLTCLITTGQASASEFSHDKERILNTIELAVLANISILQIRERFLTAKQIYELAFAASELTRKSPTKLIVNDRVDIALAAGADGVHLPELGLPVAAVRKACPPPFMIGASVHSVERASAAAHEGADFVVFGPVFDSGEKHAVGVPTLSEVCAAVGHTPVIAVGGIDASNFESVIAAGAAGYAAIRYLNDEAVLKSMAKV